MNASTARLLKQWGMFSKLPNNRIKKQYSLMNEKDRTKMLAAIRMELRRAIKRLTSLK